MNPQHERLAELALQASEQDILLESPAFRRWFGASPLRSEDGRPMVLYHGTTADISAFDLSAAGSDGVLYSLPGIFATDDSELAGDYAHNKLSRDIGGAMRALQRYKNLNPGSYGADYEERYQALQYEFARARQDGVPELGDGANVLPVYVSLQNPLVVDAGGRKFMEVIPDAVRRLTEGGHDGLIVNDVIDHASDAVKRPARIVMALDPGQLKSVIGNDGSYDFNNPDIRYSQAAVGNFDEWFRGSKVARRGRPMVMYHRTASDFDAFDTDRGDLGAHFGTAEQAESLLGGHLRDGERTIPVYLNIKNPLRLTDKGGFHADAVAPQLKRAGLIDQATSKRLAAIGLNGRVAERQEANREIKAILAAAGYDGVVYRNTTEGSGDSYIAFYSWQIASAITNGPGAPAMQIETSTPDSVRAAISHLVRVSADELADGLGSIVVTTSEEVQAGALGEAVQSSLNAADQSKRLGNVAVSHAFREMVDSHRDALESVLFNWQGCELGRDDDSIVWLPSRDPHRPRAGGRGPGKKAFLTWLMGDGPFDAVSYGPDIRSDAEWCGAVETLRSVVSGYSPAPENVGMSPQLKAWFGDSKVVDADGSPRVVFHGTKVNFTTFLPSKDGLFGSGIYLTGSRLDAGQYADADDGVMQVFAKIERPYLTSADYDYAEEKYDIDSPAIRMIDDIFDCPEGVVDQLRVNQFGSLGEEVQRQLEAMGHDGIVATWPDGEEVIVAFRPEQIKSATSNRGSYDPKDPDIRHSLAGLDPRAQAWHDVATNTTVFLADRIPAGKEASVFLHEIVHRHGRQALPEGQWGALVGQVKAWAQAEPQSPERAIHDAAAARVATAGVAGALADEELFAYAVEEAVARGVEPTAAAIEGSAAAWLQAVVESIQRVSDKLLGNDLKELSGQDLVDLAYALAQLDSPEHGVDVRRALQEETVARLEGDLPIVSDVYGDQIQVNGTWFHAERIFGRPASTYGVGDSVPQLAEGKRARIEEPDEVVSSDLFRESGANITDERKLEAYAQAMREYGGWGDFPPCVGRVEVVFEADVDRFEEMAESGTAHELGFSRALERNDVGRRYIHLENGHHRSYAAQQSGIGIPVFDLNVQERGRDFIGFAEGPTP